MGRIEEYLTSLHNFTTRFRQTVSWKNGREKEYHVTALACSFAQNNLNERNRNMATMFTKRSGYDLRINILEWKGINFNIEDEIPSSGNYRS